MRKTTRPNLSRLTQAVLVVGMLAGVAACSGGDGNDGSSSSASGGGGNGGGSSSAGGGGGGESPRPPCLAVVEGDQLFVVEPDGSGKRVVEDLPAGGDYRRVAWQSDGTRIAVDERERDIVVFDLDGNEINTLAGFELQALFPNGDVLGIADGALNRIALTSGNATPIDLSGTIAAYDASLSADGTVLGGLFSYGPLEGQDHVFVAAPDGGNAEDLTPDYMRQQVGGAVSPDGRWIATRRRDTDGTTMLIALVPTDGGSVSSPSIGVPFGWSGDGKQVLASLNGHLVAIDVVTGSESVLPVTGLVSWRAGCVAPGSG